MIDSIRVAAVATALALCGPAAGAAPDGDGSLERVKAANVLRCGGDAEGGAPFCFQDPADPTRIIGFEIDLARLVGRELGVEARFVQCDWKNLVPTLERGEIDLAWNGLEKDDELAQRVRLTRPYFVFTETLAVRPDETRFSDLDSLDGHRVGTLASTLAHKLLRARKDVEIVLYDDDVAPYVDLLERRVDAVVLDDIIAARHVEEEGVRIANGDLLRGVYVGATRREEDTLGAAIDAAIAKLVESGELRAVLRTWKIDHERQSTLDAPDDPRAKELFGDAAVRVTGFTSGHLLLFLRGAGMTLVLSVASFALAIALGAVLCLAKVYGGPVARTLSSSYIELFRGTPILLQLYLLYFGISEFVRLPALVAAVVGLAMNYAAYEAEVYRAGLLAVPRGQVEAARALGLTGRQTLRHVVFPQAFRVALPPMANDFIALLKDTSIVSVITVVELTKQYSITAHDLGSWLLPGALCALLYFAMSYPLTLVARALERRYAT